MIRARIVIAPMLVVALMAGCKKKEAAPENPGTDTATTATAPGAAEKAEEFDINQYPVSEVGLGDFPYITLPSGYSNKGFGQTNKTFARFPFWVNGKTHWVEGKFHGEVFAAEAGHDGSEFEVKRNFDELVKQMGGVKVSEGRVPTETIKEWGDEITQGFIDGLGNVYSAPATTYLVRRNDGNIWIHLVADNVNYAYVIGQEKAFQQTAGLVPASELKKQIDSAGKVALQVNFATDKTDILPDSMPQIEQVVALLKEDPALKLAVNGHTDNSGDKAHNQSLSEGRAKAVVAALQQAGIDASRLQASGMGDTQPVADNATEEGKAKNRRVELIKQ